MAKGIASRNSLKALAHPLQQFLAGWGAQHRPSAHSPGDDPHTNLPAPYELAALRGEGVLRERFFGAFMDKLPVTLSAGQQLAVWRDLVEDGGYLTAWVQRLGIAKALRREALVPANATDEARKLYCLLLDALARQAPELLPWAVEGYFWHCWKQRFPAESSVAEPQATTAQALRERLTRALRKHHGEAVTLKESFRESTDAVHFALLIKRASLSQWEELIALERPRLKTARLSAYGEALRQLTAS